MIPKLKRRLYQFLLLLRPLIYLSLVVLVFLFFYWLIPKFKPLIKVTSIFNPEIKALSSFRDRTNILLLGVGGGTHPGADLTDSLILVSIDLKTSDTVLISLPRDIWVESLSAKLNTAYHYGETKEPGGGLILAKAAVSEIINQPVHYAALLDFSGFEKAVDVVGGIDFNVPHGFIDDQYPILGNEDAPLEKDRYTSLQFFPGFQHMDGATALKYIRSRYAKGEEGTDFARSERQQRVLLAFKDKVLSSATLLHPAKIKALYKTAESAIKTDLPQNADLVKLALRIKSDSLRTGIIDQGSDNEEIPPLLYNPPATLYGQWVLLPINNNWEPVHRYVSELLYQNKP